MSEWQPIDTAPTNTAIQVFIPNCEYYGSAVYSGMLVDMGTGKRWMTYGWAIGRDCGVGAQPSHWKPLPEAPPPPNPRRVPGNGERE